jgi:hypothetical protein
VATAKPADGFVPVTTCVKLKIERFKASNGAAAGQAEPQPSPLAFTGHRCSSVLRVKPGNPVIKVITGMVSKLGDKDKSLEPITDLT